jgi:nucleoside-diphosphate-sugar epimerase
MRIFLAGASGVIGRRLTPLLLAADHQVTGMTRSPTNARALEATGIIAAVVDVFDPDALKGTVISASPEIVIHQLTDLPRVFDEAQLAAFYPRNARIRTEGTHNLIAAAQAASVRRFIVQCIAFGYGTGVEPHSEADPLNLVDGPRVVTVRGAADIIVLRYGFFYGPGTWTEEPARKPPLHVDAAAHAALLAVTRGRPGIYNIAEDDGTVSIAKARNELGFDPAFRLAS